MVLEKAMTSEMSDTKSQVFLAELLKLFGELTIWLRKEKFRMQGPYGGTIPIKTIYSSLETYLQII